jgi:hypothetical protein
VTGTLPGADVRGFYQALGIELPGWSRREASVACFSRPDAHAHGDRDPSCSVNVETGAWRCWGCGAAGGAYDAALACGRDPRGAIELMITHGLAIRRAVGLNKPALRPPSRAAIALLTGCRRQRRGLRWRWMSAGWLRPGPGWRRWCGPRGCSGPSRSACGRAPLCLS